MTYCFMLNYYIYIVLGLLILIIQFYLGYIFKRCYVADANDYVDKVMSNNASYEISKNMCIKQGGIDNRVFILVIVVGIVFTVINKISINFLVGKELVVHFPEELASAVNNGNDVEYAKGIYKYYEFSFRYKDSSNDCEFSILKNNEYIIQDNKDAISVGRDFLKDTYSIENDLEIVTFNNIDFVYYNDKLNDKYYYLYIDDSDMQLIKVDVSVDVGGKCTSYREYIINNVAIE